MPIIPIRLELANATPETQAAIAQLPTLPTYDQNIQALLLLDSAPQSADHRIILQSTNGLTSVAPFTGRETSDCSVGIHFAACNVSSILLADGNVTEASSFFNLAYTHRPSNAAARHPFMAQPYNALMDTITGLDQFTPMVEPLTQYQSDGTVYASPDNRANAAGGSDVARATPSHANAVALEAALETTLKAATRLSASSQRASGVTRAWATWAKYVNAWIMSMRRLATAILLDLRFPINGSCRQKAQMFAEVLDLISPFSRLDFYIVTQARLKAYRSELGSRFVPVIRQTLSVPYVYNAPKPPPTTVKDIVPVYTRFSFTTSTRFSRFS